MASATFVGPNGEDPRLSINRTVQSLQTVTTGDMLYAGQLFRSKIRERTLAGTDVNGAPFAPYSIHGPYYLYPNRGSAGSNRQARATAAKNRYEKTGRVGRRTPFGIRYDSYAAAKAAHGVANVNLYGMEQHTHMLDTILVKTGAIEASPELDILPDSEFAAFEQNSPATTLAVGFYGPEAARAQGNNEGNSNLPARNFFALNLEDLQLAEIAIGKRIQKRTKST
jgi:hypothetical protein